MDTYTTAILFDTMSIQKFVFGSNKLVDNLGASYIIEHIYDGLKENDELKIGYVGGGNALYFTNGSMQAKRIIKTFTTEILHKYPGVTLAVAIDDNCPFTTSDYSNKIQKLFKKLRENKGKFLPVNVLPSHGINAPCRFSSFSSEVIEEKKGEFLLISSVTASKRIMAQKARKQEQSLLHEAGMSDFSFPDEFDDLGQKKGEDSHIAVVHIDGNGFGQVFINLNSLEETKSLSHDVKKAVRTAFIDTLKNYKLHEESFQDIIDQSGKKTLPIRPIILGGDDVTFVCHGKLGIWFAEKFMKSFNSNLIFNDSNRPYSSCAGIAIVKTKYPFYRAYQMAEELCKSAKKKSRDNNGGNYIDFQFAFSGLGNTLKEIRDYQYSFKNEQVLLLKRPYSIDTTNYDSGSDFSQVKKWAKRLQETLPNSKIKDLREILDKDISSRKQFIEHLKNQHPKSVTNESEGFSEVFGKDNNAEAIISKYPFFDMIELLEIYPVTHLSV